MNASPDEIKEAVLKIASDYKALVEEHQCVLEILESYTPLEIETKDLAKHMGLTLGQLNVWLCAGTIPFLSFRRGNGYAIHEYIQHRGWAKMLSRPIGKGSENYIVWTLKGRAAIQSEWKDWRQRNEVSDIEKLKR